MNKLDLKGITFLDLRGFLESIGEPKFRAAQIFDWLYSSRMSHRINTIHEMSNLGKTCLDKLLNSAFLSDLVLEDVFSFNPGFLESAQKEVVNKYVFRTSDNYHVPAVSAFDKLILSTQIGCTHKCKFCSSGKRGLVRNLTAGEIVDQVVKVQNHAGKSDCFSKIEFSGMGEPLSNFDAVIKAMDIIRSDSGLNIHLKKISLFTCGIPSGIKDLSETKVAVNLVVSLHSVDNKLRSSMMPVNKKHDIEKIIDAVKIYINRTGRLVTFDYMLIEGVNDSLADAKSLADKMRGVPVRIRISPCNPVPRAGFVSARFKWREQFVKILTANNLDAEMNDSFGTDIKAGYGQLKNADGR